MAEKVRGLTDTRYIEAKQCAVRYLITTNKPEGTAKHREGINQQPIEVNDQVLRHLYVPFLPQNVKNLKP